MEVTSHSKVVTLHGCEVTPLKVVSPTQGDFVNLASHGCEVAKLSHVDMR